MIVVHNNYAARVSCTLARIGLDDVHLRSLQFSHFLSSLTVLAGHRHVPLLACRRRLLRPVLLQQAGATSLCFQCLLVCIISHHLRRNATVLVV